MSEQGGETSATQQGQQGSRNVPARVGESRLRRLDPMDLFEEMQQEMARLWGSGPFGSFPFGRSLRRLGSLASSTMPRADVYEQGNRLVVKAELPGVKKEDVDLAIEDGDLVIRAEQRQEQEVKEENYYRMERQFGSIYRRLPLPPGVQADQIEAKLADGVLEVRVPKPAAAEAQAKKIQIR